MSSGIPRQPTTGDLAAYAVARPVSGNHLLRWGMDEGFLLGHNTQPVIAQKFLSAATTTRTIWVSYTRNPGAKLLMIDMESHKGTKLEARGTVELKWASGTLIDWTASPSAAHEAFDGTVGGFRAHSEDNSQRYRVRVFLKLDDALAVGVRDDLKVKFTNVDGHNGIAKLTIIECPIATADTVRDLDDVGTDLAALYSGLVIASGDPATSPRGMARLLRQRDQALNQNRLHWQICEAELDAHVFTTTSAGYATLMAAYSARNPTWRIRARRTGKTSDFDVRTLGFRYRVSGGGTAQLRMLVNGTPTAITGLVSNVYVEKTTTVSIPCNGTPDQEVTIQIEGNTTAGQLYCSRARLTPP